MTAGFLVGFVFGMIAIYIILCVSCFVPEYKKHEVKEVKEEDAKTADIPVPVFQEEKYYHVPVVVERRVPMEQVAIYTDDYWKEREMRKVREMLAEQVAKHAEYTWSKDLENYMFCLRAEVKVLGKNPSF